LVVVRGLVVVVVVAVVLLGLVVERVEGVVVPARGVDPVPAHAPSARQAATANQKVRRMVTEGSPTPRPSRLTMVADGVQAPADGA
jgi:hypothetical protein